MVDYNLVDHNFVDILYKA